VIGFAAPVGERDFLSQNQDNTEFIMTSRPVSVVVYIQNNGGTHVTLNGNPLNQNNSVRLTITHSYGIPVGT
jgi:ABC-type thiamine transport system ATPase subunit